MSPTYADRLRAEASQHQQTAAQLRSQAHDLDVQASKLTAQAIAWEREHADCEVCHPEQ